MYLHIGGSMSVRADAIIGIFDLDNTTVSKHTRAFLSSAETEGNVIAVTDEIPKAFVLAEEFGFERVYLTQLSAATIKRRSHEPAGSGLTTKE